MLHVNVEELMKQGHSPEEIVQLVSDEIYSKVEQEAARVAAEKKAAEEAKKASQRLQDAREFAVAALKDYFSLLLEEEISEDTVRTALENIEKLMPSFGKKGKTLKVKFNTPEDMLLVADLLSDLMFK